MHLFLATDSKRKAENIWFVGATKSTAEKIKEDLPIDKKSGSVDFVVKTPQAKEILSLFQENVGHENIDKNTLLVQGDHGRLAQLLIQITRDYEIDHPSIRRSMVRWFKNVNS